MSGRWLKLYHKFKDWEWYDDKNTKCLFIHLLLSANYKPLKWRGMDVPRGSLITSRAKLAQETKMTEREVRTSLTRLISTSEIAIKTTNKFTIVTICNYERYQDENSASVQQIDQQNDQRPTSKRPADDQQTTTSIEYVDSKIGRKKENKTTTITAIASASPDAQVAAGKGEVNFEALKKFVNETLDEAGATIPRIKDMSDQRRAMVLARIKQHGKEAFATVIEKAARSSFLNGGGNKGFRADFSWIIRPNNFLKILEGNYDDNSISTPSINLHNGTTTTTGQHTNAASVRREQFARHIIAKITSPDTPEPDISGNY